MVYYIKHDGLYIITLTLQSYNHKPTDDDANVIDSITNKIWSLYNKFYLIPKKV